MAALNGDEISVEVSEMLWNSKEVRKHLLENRPIKHEGVITYSLQRALGGGKQFEELRKLTRVGSIETDWMERWFSHSSDLIDREYRDFTTNILSKTLGVMSPADEESLKNWSNQDNEFREENRISFESSLRRRN